MVNWKSRKLGDILALADVIVLVLLVNILASYKFFRVDLTEEKRYSISEQTRTMLGNVDDDVYVEVFLAGELNASFRRFQKNIAETLEEFRIYSGNKVQYTFTDPAMAMGQKAQAEFMQDLASRGIQPTNVIDRKDGQRVEKLLFPGAIISYGGLETGVMLLKGNKARTPEEEINQSIEGIEYELATAIYKLTNEDRQRIGWVTGHGELNDESVASWKQDLHEFYDLEEIDLSQARTSRYAMLIVAKPTDAYSVTDKFYLDQYIMRGGKVLFLLDRINATMDSAANEGYMAVPYQTNLDDLLFRYGLRLNPDLLQDLSSGFYPVVTGQVGNKPQVQLMEWPYFPRINRYADHPVTRNLDAVMTRFVSSIDTVKAEGVKKTPLLFTSQYARVLGAPVQIHVNDLRKKVDPEGFTQQYLPVGYLLEGSFTSLFKNRFIPEGVAQATLVEKSAPTKLIVFSDGDLARNEVNMRTRQVQPLGFDPFTNVTFANRDLLMNAVLFLTEENGLIQARSKQVKIRPLDPQRIVDEKTKWQAVNLVVPVVLLILYGLLRAYWRKRKFARF